MRRLLIALCLLIVGCAPIAAQQSASNSTSVVPRLIRFSGTVKEAKGTVGITFSLYKQQQGGAPIWTEIQNVKLDETGKYNVLLGATKSDGLPTELFTSGEAQWLGVRVEGSAEQSRVLLVSVPYAMKAAEADTLGGKPLSAFVLSGTTTGKGADGLTYINPEATSASVGITPNATSGNVNYIARFTNSTDLGNSILYQNGSRIGVNTLSPAAGFHVIATSAIGGMFESYSGAAGNALTTPPFFQRAARGTPAAPVALTTSDIMGGFIAGGYDGTGITSTRAGLLARAAGPWTGSSNPTYLAFFTTDTNSTTFNEQIRILPNGNVGVGTTSPSAKLHVAGNALITGATTFGGPVTFAGGQTYPGATVASSAPLTGDGSGGAPLTIPLATGSTSGYLSSGDWNTFNGKLAPNGNGSGLTNVNAATLGGLLPTNWARLYYTGSGEPFIQPTGFGYFQETDFSYPGALVGRSLVTTGASWGVYGMVESSAGVGGIFRNNAGGKALSALVNGAEVMNVTNTGMNLNSGALKYPDGTTQATGIKMYPFVGGGHTFSIPAASGYVFFGTPISITLTANRHVTAAVQVPLGTASGTTTARIGICRQLSGGSIYTLLNDSWDIVIGASRGLYPAAASGVLSAGTYSVGPCVYNTGGTTLNNNELAVGYVMVTD